MRPAMLRTLFGCSGSTSVVRTSLGRASTIPFQPRRNQSTLKPPSYTIDGTTYDTDSYSNTPSSILSKLPRRLHQQPSHPIGIIRRIIEDHFEGYTSVSPSTPIVTVSQNFDELGFPPDHPGRALTDSYYLNKTHMLRTHTSAHEVETYKSKLDNWLLSADVYRRDEIDKSHYPVFHQMEGTHVWPSSDLDKLVKLNEELEAKLAECPLVIEDETRISESNPYQKQHDPKHAEQIARHLKNSLNGMIFRLFGPIAMKDGEPLRIRWIEAFFPFTTPSYEVEVWWNGEWLEVLGSGVVMQKTLEQAGVPEKSGWAFGLGLERLAMVLFSIPDIRLFWSEDERFLSQFEPGKINQFKPYSKYPPCIRDMSFWIPAQGDTVDAGTTPSWHDNDYCEIVRDVAGDLIENVQLTDEFTHPKTKKRSATYRLTYRSMDRNLSNQEVNAVQAKVEERVVAEMGIQMR